MKSFLITAFLISITLPAFSQVPPKTLPYVENGHARHVLDIYAPTGAKNLPVVFWIHGGGWQTGDKANVQEKPRYFMEKGFVFVSINHRLLPDVVMEDLVGDVAKAFAWVQHHIAEYGGDPSRVLVGGHSSGAQLAALLCTDDRWLKKEGVSFDVLIGCVPVDGDTYDIPAIIEVAETRRRVHHEPQASFGHRQKFGNDPRKHVDFSTVTHVAAGKGISPFLILHVAENADTGAQARRLAAVLKGASIPATVVGVRETSHEQLNANLGKPGDPGSEALFAFVKQALGR